MSGTLVLRNRQRTRRVDARRLDDMIRWLLLEVFHRGEFELGIHLIGETAMIRMNQTYLRHGGSTDVITFDYCDPARPDWLAGEIFICVPEAIIQSRRFRTTWQGELARYLIHALLHLTGFDDRTPAARRRMKSREDRHFRRLAANFSLPRLDPDFSL